MKETNMEHYRSEIETACHGIKLKNGEIYMCHGAAKCSDCEFRDMYAGLGCQRAIVRWLMSEYKPEPFLTAREKHFVEFVQEGWLARDENGDLEWHKEKPFKYEGFEWRNDGGRISSCCNGKCKSVNGHVFREAVRNE